MFLAVVPAYNEENSIGKVVKGLCQNVDEVVVVDDGSTDQTGEIAQRNGAKAIRHEINRGQGASLETGRQYAENKGTDYLLFFDGDGQFDPQEVKPALKKLKEEQADVLFGSRFIARDSQTPWSKKYLLLPLARAVDSVFTGLSLSDVHNGFKILSRRAIEEIRITQDRMAHASEIPKQVKEKELDYIEFPISVSYNRYGQGAKEGLSVIRDLILGQFID
ncbi:MAG: glycosyltransferase family 2 protein [Candidatus Paceibacteria bacterium]